MRRVYKYPLQPNDEVALALPKGAEVLDVQVQFDKPCLWALVDPEAEQMEQRRFRIVGTGHLLTEEDLTWIGTVQMMEGRLVLHVFEIEP